MSFRAQITKGKVKKPYFVLIYGTSGIGKTTFAAAAPKPLFINLEDGTDEMDVAEMPRPKSFTELMAQVEEMIVDPTYDNSTLVIDSLTRLEPMVWEEVCKEAKPAKASIVKFGYGEGYKLSNDKWKKLIEKLSALRSIKKWNIILIAHPEVKDVPDPAQIKDYARWQPRLHKDAMAMFVEACSAVLFAEVETFVLADGDDKRGKAMSEGVRIMKTEFRPTHIAKNRYGLPYQLPLSWDAFDEAAKIGNPDSPAAIRSRMNSMLLELNNEELKSKVTVSMAEAKEDAARLSGLENLLKVRMGETKKDVE